MVIFDKLKEHKNAFNCAMKAYKKYFSDKIEAKAVADFLKNNIPLKRQEYSDSKTSNAILNIKQIAEQARISKMNEEHQEENFDYNQQGEVK